MKRPTTFFIAAIWVAALIGFLIGLRVRAGSVPSLVASAQTETVQTQEGECKMALLQGTFAFDVWGTVNASSVAPSPYAAVGLLSLDGRGGVTLVNAQSTDRVFVPSITLKGYYNLGSDCTGRMTLTSGTAYNMVAADGGREIHLIQTNTHSVVRGVAKKI